MIKVAEFREFYEVYRGEKEYFLALKMVEKYDDIVYHVFVPSIPSPLDKQFGFGNEQFLQTVDEINRYSPRYKVILYDAFPLKITNEVYLSIPSNPFATFKKVALFKPDVLVDIPFTTLTPRSYFVYLTSKKLNAPLILFYSGDLPRKYLTTRKFFRPLERTVFKDAALIISYNYAYLLYLTKNHTDLNITGKSSTLPKLINYERFNQDKMDKRILCLLKKKLGLEGKFVVGYVGRFEKRKGITTLINLAKLIKYNKKFADRIKILLVGDGNLRHHLEAIIRREKLPITLFGPLSSKTIPYIYTLVDVAVFPTVPFFSTTLLEAMASGKIIVSIFNGESGYEHYSTPLINNHNSIIIQDHDNTPKKILDVLEEIMKNRHIYEALGENAKKDIINSFSIEKLCLRYRKLIEVALKRYSQTSSRI